MSEAESSLSSAATAPLPPDSGATARAVLTGPGAVAAAIGEAGGGTAAGPRGGVCAGGGRPHRDRPLADLVAEGVAAEILVRHVGEIGAAEIGDGELAEHVVDDRGRHLDPVIAHDHAVRLEAREDERVHELLKRHAVLETEGDRDGEAVHQAAEGRALLVHVEEDLAEAAVLVVAGAEIHL